MKCCNSKTFQRQNVAVVNRYKVKMLQYKTSQQTKRWVDAKCPEVVCEWTYYQGTICDTELRIQVHNVKIL
jgi:hypothetical protein